MPQIKITVDTTGKITIDGDGFHGRDCQRYIQSILNQLGKATVRRPKKEALQVTHNRQQQRTRG